ncbi:MAG: DUF5107 domain-containing protein [Fimbriimonadaceae bacterium]|nr:DUF5107 domain-containing protein [Fimbriimonadaceae bacterium]
MTELRVERLAMPAADLGPDSPLPPLVSERELHEVAHADGVPAEIVRNLGTGHVPSVLPYTMQDGYDRRLVEREFRVAVLENAHLRATFLLERGGRLWSLFDKASGRELLYRNACVQYANLALRNAWFAGGVEWNCGVIGHSPQTCSSVYAARLDGPDGEPVLRLYEYERIRGVLYELDCRLPGDSPYLFVTITIRNPREVAIPMYWWSNMAVPQAPDVRVLVPAERAFSFGYRSRLDVIPFPEAEGFDASYPSRASMPRDYFFDVPRERRKWIAAVDGDGRGVVQASTARLKGRKLFVWGTGPAGSNWQRLLSPLGGEYFEIQAGLAQTQLEYLAMPAQSEWTWTEAYGPIESSPAADHASATAALESSLDASLPMEILERVETQSKAWCHLRPVEALWTGSGWGAVEQVRRRLAGDPSLPDAGLPMQSNPGSDEAAWIEFLEAGAAPPTSSFQVAEGWSSFLGNSPMHQGVARFYRGDTDAAIRTWYRSLGRSPSPVTCRNLAVASCRVGKVGAAVAAYRSAMTAGSPSLVLAREALGFLAQHDPRAVIELLPRLPRVGLDDGRVRLAEARAALALGDVDPARRFFADRVVVPDLREGDTALESLWNAYQAATGGTATMPNAMRLAMTE